MPGSSISSPSRRSHWPAAAPKPDWTWWQPAGNELVTQWRTTPVVVDWDEDGLNDLLMLDHEGYLALFRRELRDGELMLGPGTRMFLGGVYDSKGTLKTGVVRGFLTK